MAQLLLRATKKVYCKRLSYVSVFNWKMFLRHVVSFFFLSVYQDVSSREQKQTKNRYERTGTEAKTSSFTSHQWVGFGVSQSYECQHLILWRFHEELSYLEDEETSENWWVQTFKITYIEILITIFLTNAWLEAKLGWGPNLEADEHVNKSSKTEQ